MGWLHQSIFNELWFQNLILVVTAIIAFVTLRSSSRQERRRATVDVVNDLQKDPIFIAARASLRALKDDSGNINAQEILLPNDSPESTTTRLPRCFSSKPSGSSVMRRVRVCGAVRSRSTRSPAGCGRGLADPAQSGEPDDGALLPGFFDAFEPKMGGEPYASVYAYSVTKRRSGFVWFRGCAIAAEFIVLELVDARRTLRAPACADDSPIPHPKNRDVGHPLWFGKPDLGHPACVRGRSGWEKSWDPIRRRMTRRSRPMLWHWARSLVSHDSAFRRIPNLRVENWATDI